MSISTISRNYQPNIPFLHTGTKVLCGSLTDNGIHRQNDSADVEYLIEFGKFIILCCVCVCVSVSRFLNHLIFDKISRNRGRVVGICDWIKQNAFAELCIAIDSNHVYCICITSVARAQCRLALDECALADRKSMFNAFCFYLCSVRLSSLRPCWHSYIFMHFVSCHRECSIRL